MLSELKTALQQWTLLFGGAGTLLWSWTSSASSPTTNVLVQKRCNSVMLLFWTCLVFLAPATNADALEITGPYVIDTSVTWSSANSPINVTGEIDIQQNGVLTVLEDVQMNFLTAESGILNSAGTLVMRGEPAKRIVLQGADETSYWSGITFGPAALGATYELTNVTATFESGSVLQFVDVNHAGKSDTNAFQFTRSAPYLLGIDFIECYDRKYLVAASDLQNVLVAKYLRALKASAESSYYPWYGVSVRGSSSTTGVAILENLDFSQVPFYRNPVYIRSLSLLSLSDSACNGEVYIYSVVSCQVVRNEITIPRSGLVPIEASYMGGSGGAGVIISENKLTAFPGGSAQTALTAYYWYSTPEEQRITYNSLYNGRLYVYTGYDAIDFLLAHNTIQGSSYGGMYIYGGGQFNAGEFTVMNNTMARCESSNYNIFVWLTHNYFGLVSQNVIKESSVYSSGRALMYLRGRSNYQTSASWNVTTNAIMNCTVGAGASALYFDNYPISRFESNTFENIIAADGSSSVTLNLVSSFTKEDHVYLPNNFWGEFQPDIVSIRSTVKDGLTTATGGIVDFVSVLEGPDLSGTTTNVSLPAFFLPDGSLGGIVSAGTTVELPAGKYNCTLSIIVEGDAELILEPGVAVSFLDNLALSVGQEGQLSASGTEAMPIILKSLSSDSSWEGLHLVTKNSTKFSYVVIKDAKYGILHTGDGELVLDSVLIQSAVYRCLQSIQASSSWNVENNNLVVRDSQFLGCGSSKGGIYIRRRKRALLSNITVVGGYSGVYSNRDVETFSLINSLIKDTTSYYGLFVSNRYGSSSYVEVVNNTIFHTRGGMYIYSRRSEMDLSGNSVRGNGLNTHNYHAMYLVCYSCYTVRVHSSTFSDWDSSSVAAASVTYSAQNEDGSGLYLESNYFQNISAQNILDVQYQTAYNATNLQGYFGPDLFAASSSEPALVVLRDWPTLDNFGFPCTFSGNIFTGDLRNDTEQYYLYVTESATEVPEIVASGCYWNTADVVVLLDGIHDGRDSGVTSTVEYNPFLLTDNPLGPSLNATPPFRNGFTIQGRLEQGDSETLKAGNYTTAGSLFLDGNLTLEPGVTIFMDDGASLSIEYGSLTAVGTPTDPVRFVASSGSSWGQIVVLSTAASFEMEHVSISGAGSLNAAALNIKRASALRNITIFDCSSGALQLSGSGEGFLLEDFSFYDTSGSGHRNVYLVGDRNVNLKRGFLSSSASAELEARQNVRLFIDSLEVVPQYYYAEGFYLHNEENEISGLVFNSTVFFPGWYRGYPLFISNWYMKSFTIQESVVEFGNLYYPAVYVYMGMNSNFFLKSSRFCGNQGRFLRVHYTNATILEDSTFVASSGSYAVTLSSTKSAAFFNNSWEGMDCSGGHCLSLPVSQGLIFVDNSLLGMEARSPNSILSFTSLNQKVMLNSFKNCTGYSLVSFYNVPAQVNFTNNKVLNSESMDFLLSTSSTFENINGGQHIVGSNYWGTTDFRVLQSKTFDGLSDTSLALIEYSGIYADEELSTVLLPPPSASILDNDVKTIGGAITEDLTLVVPAGLYYAPKSILLQHPNATLVFETGVKIMFHESASLTVRQGEFKALGTAENPIFLTSTDRFISQFGSADVANTSQWGGIWFLPDAVDAVVDGTEYVEGSVFRQCIIQNGGYGGRPAALYLDGTSAMLDGVQILKSGYRGIYARNTEGTIVIKDTTIRQSSYTGLEFYNMDKMIDLKGVAVTGATRQGLYLRYCSNVRVSGSHFSENYAYSSEGHQVYSQYSQGYLNISSR